MRKIRLSDTDVELFDIEIAPSEYTFYQRHKDAFRTMWKEQGKPFWTRYVITFRSFTVKHGVIKQMNIDSPKFENLIDQAFIFIYEQFVDGKEKTAKNFLEDIAKLAQNQDKFPALDSKSFARDPFYLRETRELFRSFFGMPDQKSSYLKVYILCPVFMRFGGSICRCLEKWLTAEIQEDPNDDSYWMPPQEQTKEKCAHNHCTHDIVMCEQCIEDCGEKFFNEKILGQSNGPKFLKFWTLGDPRFNDADNPLFAPHMDPLKDWRNSLTAESFREFLYYAKCRYGDPEDKCDSCIELRKHRDKVLKMSGTDCRHKKKKDGREVDLTQLEGFKVLRDKLKKLDLDEFEGMDLKHCKEETAINVTEKLLNIMKVKGVPTDLEELKEEERRIEQYEKHKRQAKKRQRRKEKKAQAKKDNSPEKEASPSPDRASQLDSDDDDDTNDDTVGAFKIERDEKKGVISVTVTTSKENNSKKNGLQSGTSKLKGLPDGVSLTIDLIREQITGLPKFFEFWEGAGCLIAVLNYEFEEKDECEKPTNFTVKVAGVNNKLHENIIVKLLFYVQKRKKRKSLGWNMDADDVVACILPDDDPQLAGLTVTIIRGNYFKAKLSKKERASLRQSLAVKKILMMLEPSVAKEIREMPNGKDRLMSIISQVCSNDTKREKMKRFNELWERLLESPTKFDFVLTCNSGRIEELKKIGLRQLDISYEEFMAANCPSVTVCRNCCKVQNHCDCSQNRKDWGLITGDMGVAICTSHGGSQSGDSVWCLKHEEPNDAGKHPTPGSGDVGERLEQVLGDIKQKVGHASPHNVHQRIIDALGDTHIKDELTAVMNSADEEFLIKKLLEGTGKNDLSELDIITEDVTYEEPAPPNKKPVPGMTKNFSLSFVKGCKETTFNVKLEAYEPDNKHPGDGLKNIQRNPSSDEKLNMKAQEIKQALEQVSGMPWTEKPDPATESPVYCEKHRPAAEKKSPTNGNSPTKQNGKSGMQFSIGFGKKPNIPMSYNTTNEKTSPAGKGDGSFKPDYFSVDLHNLCLVSVANENKENKSANGKGPSPANENKENKSANGKGSSPANENKAASEKASSPASENSCKKSPADEKSVKTEEIDRLMSIGPACNFLASLAKEISQSKDNIDSSDAKTKPTNGKKETETEKLRKENKKTNGVADKQALKHCGHCGNEEPRRKAFKKCQKCKEEGVKNVRYYCGRECQDFCGRYTENYFTVSQWNR